MPCIDISTNKKLSEKSKEEIKSNLGRAIEIIPRKSEKWLMCVFRDDVGLWYRGGDQPGAYIEGKLFGDIERETSERVTAAVTETVARETDIPADRIYVSYFTTSNWGWNGKNF